MTIMLKITKEEKEYIKSKSPSTHVSITSKEKSKSKRKKFYVEETSTVLRLLEEYEDGKVELIYGEN